MTPPPPAINGQWLLRVFVYLFVCKQSCCITKADFELLVLLSQPAEGEGYRHILPHLAQMFVIPSLMQLVSDYNRQLCCPCRHQAQNPPSASYVLGLRLFALIPDSLM